MSQSDQSFGLLNYTTTIVSGFVSRNEISAELLPKVIHSVYDELSRVSQPVAPVEKLEPAVNPKKSVFPNYIICLEDGKQLTMLKRHLMATYGMTPEAYRAKWGLPASYPMTCPSYTATRSDLAKKMGFGTNSRGQPKKRRD
jgi:predicted transcriptional regulator